MQIGPRWVLEAIGRPSVTMWIERSRVMGKTRGPALATPAGSALANRGGSASTGTPA